MEWGDAGAGGAPLHRFAVPLALSGEASLYCNVCYGSPERVELSGGQLDSVKSSLDSCQRQLTEGLFPKGLTSCVKHILISRLDKSRVSAIMKIKGDTVTCSQAPS